MSDAATTQRHQRIAQWLLRQQDEKRAYAPLPPDLALKDGAEAYAVQAVFQNLASERRGPLAGGKVALTTPVMQQLVNYHQPMAGGILARTIHQSPAELYFADFVHPLVECEVAVQLGADLKPGEGPFTAEGLGSAVAACMAAIEIADDRSADYKALDPLLLIAENAWNRGCVLAPPVRNWRALDLPKARGVTRIAGREAGAGFGGDVMGGHPFASLAFVANQAAAQGRGLKRGDVVLTGSLVASKWPARGELVEVAIDGLGQARVTFV